MMPVNGWCRGSVLCYLMIDHEPVYINLPRAVKGGIRACFYLVGTGRPLICVLSDYIDERVGNKNVLLARSHGVRH